MLNRSCKCRFSIVSLVCFTLLACQAVGPDFKTPQTQLPQGFANATQTALSNEKIEQHWWQAFKDPQIDRLIEQALLGNLDLREATLRLREARLLRTNTELNLLPTITSSGSYTKRQRSVAQFGGPTPFTRQTEFFNIGFDATWELDLFGRIRRSVEANNAEIEIAEATRRDILVSLNAELVRNYIDLRGTQNRLAVARKNADNQKESLAMTLTRLEIGRGTKLDSSRASEQLNTTLATIPLLETEIRRAMHRIAVLMGRSPEVLISQLAMVKPLPQIPKWVSIGKPEDLLRRRPDIRAAEQGLASATAAAGVAVADLFPRVMFTGNIALESRSLLGLGAAGSDTYSFGPSIRWAAFDIIRVRQRIKAADAATEAQLANYQNTVLKALEETENALVNYGQQQVRLAFLRNASVDSQEAAKLAHLRYEEGVADFLAVLDAERRLLESQDQLAETETKVAEALIAVYKALGGGW